MTSALNYLHLILKKLLLVALGTWWERKRLDLDEYLGFSTSMLIYHVLSAELLLLIKLFYSFGFSISANMSGYYFGKY